MAKNNDNQVDKAARCFLWRVDQLIMQRKSWAWACVEFRELARGTKGASAISDEIGPSFEFASMDDCDSLAYFHLQMQGPAPPVPLYLVQLHYQIYDAISTQW